MIAWVTFTVLFMGLIILAGFAGGKLPRMVAWLMVVSAVAVMHWVALDAVGWLRMFWICTVLLAGMKAITYREWCADGGRRLLWARWFMFASVWVGMDPGAFVTRRRLKWRSHVWVGSGYLLAGLLGVWACYELDVRNAAILFIMISCAVHFGALRLSTALFRMMGFSVGVLFKNPLKARGFKDFWGKRWNLAFSRMIARTVKRPLVPIIGERWSMFVVFVVSVMCLVERRDTWRMALLCGVMLIVGLPYLFNEKFVNEVILPTRDLIRFIT